MNRIAPLAIVVGISLASVACTTRVGEPGGTAETAGAGGAGGVSAIDGVGGASTGSNASSAAGAGGGETAGGTDGASTTSGAGGASATSNASSSSAGPGGGAGTGGGGGSGGAAPAGPAAPIMKAAKQMGGELHVSWTNVTPDCDKLYLDRKHDSGPYALAYTLSGAATSKHDGQAIPPGTYCYKARCLKGGQESPDSNETCGTP